MELLKSTTTTKKYDEDSTEKKEKFVEALLTLGSLLAVFLGFVIDKSSFYLGYLITFGIVFIVSALLSYTALIFKEEATNPTIRRWTRAVNGIMGLAFGGMITIGAALVLSQIQGTYPVVIVYAGAVIVLVGSMLGTFWFIRTVMALPDITQNRTPDSDTNSK